MIDGFASAGNVIDVGDARLFGEREDVTTLVGGRASATFYRQANRLEPR
jgi:hypothetical protein